MSSHRQAQRALLIAALMLAACTQIGPATTRDSGSTGATMGGAGGSLSGTAAPARESEGEKEQRGNTPPGMDRDGHGPASGAIVDPTGAATRGKPY